MERKINNQQPIKPNDFRYVLLPGTLPEPKHKDTYMHVYDIWKEVWVNAFQELKVDKPFYSDSFTRQDYIGALFYKNRCFAMAFYRWTDASRADFVTDSYFYNWNDDHRKHLRSRGDKIIVCSYFTVHPNGRGSVLGLSGKDLLMGMITKTFMNSGADAMTGAVRINKGVNTAGEKWGTTLIAGHVDSGYDADVDLIGFFKDTIAVHPANELSDLTEFLWSNSMIIPRIDLSQEFTFALSDQKAAA